MTTPPPSPLSAISPTPSLSFRGRISSPEDGYLPRCQLETRIRAGIGTILNEREWWLKWHQDGGAIRKKWLQELEHTLIVDTLDSSTCAWIVYMFQAVVLPRFELFPVDGSEDQQRTFIKTMCEKTNYNLIWNVLWWTPLDGMEGDVDQTETEEEFIEGNARLESYSQIVWYFTLEHLKKKLLGLPLAVWPLTPAFDVDRDEMVTDAATFLIAVREGEVTDTNFHEFLPDGDRSPKTVDAVKAHVFRIVQELIEIRLCVVTTLENVITENELDTPEGPLQYLSPGPAQETWMSDVLISRRLKTKLVDQVAGLESEAKDGYPAPKDLILGIVDPSLYCCVYGTTRQVPEANTVPPSTPDTAMQRMHRIAFAATAPVENKHRGDAEYQWIPSEFQVDADGTVQVLTYINNLHPDKHSEMYETITPIFERFVPLFDRVLSCLLTEHGPEPSMTIPDPYEREINEIPNHPRIPDTLSLEAEAPQFTIRGSTVQVIVKIAEIHLTPENPSYPGDAWHAEGSDAEQIVATGIYYFGCENITESKLAFRVIVKKPGYQEHDVLSIERLAQEVGAVVAHEDRCVVFPNTLQHRVEPFELEDKTKPGVCKTLVFFLVDPSKTIPSTAVIPPQQESWLSELSELALDTLRTVPDVVRKNDVGGVLSRGMTLRQVQEYRARLTVERSPQVDQLDDERIVFYPL